MKEQLSLPGFPDEPELFDSLETWEQFLTAAWEILGGSSFRWKRVVWASRWPPEPLEIYPTPMSSFVDSLV